jgi:hypothetical protein
MLKAVDIMERRRIGIVLEMPEEFKQVVEIEKFKETEYIYEQNCHELIGALSHSNENKKDIKRKLHNFLTANSTIIDHTRKLLKYCPELNEEIGIKINKEFESSPLSNFIKNLRNYITHHSLPLTLRPIRLEKDDLVIGSVVFDRNTLLKWSGWNKQSKIFLINSESDLIVGDIISEHFNKMADLYSWIQSLMNKEYKEVFARYDEYLDQFYPKDES